MESTLFPLSKTVTSREVLSCMLNSFRDFFWYFSLSAIFDRILIIYLRITSELGRWPFILKTIPRAFLTGF